MTRSVRPTDTSRPRNGHYDDQVAFEVPPEKLAAIPKSPKKRKKIKMQSCCIGFGIIMSILLLILGILVFFFFRDLIQSIIESKLPMRADSNITKSWIEPPVKPSVKIYFFNVSNPDEFVRGSKLKVEEVGPYVYDQKWKKVDIKWLDNGQQVEYGQMKKYVFNRKKSIGNEEDILILPNIPLISAVVKMKNETDQVRKTFDGILTVLKQELFPETNVKDILWGAEHPLVKLGNEIAPPEEKLPFDEFGIFVGKNGSYPGLIKAWTGVKDIMDIGKILSVDNKTKLDYWGPGECNEIRGTDGSVFHPNLRKDETLYLYNKDLCRSLPLVFQKEVITNQDIPGYRFVPPSNVFGTPDENPANSCFCTEKKCSTPSGVFSLAKCKFDSPIVLSWPHFFQGHETLFEAVDGLNPSQERHQFFLDLQPKLGNGLRASARTQINVAMSKLDGMKHAQGFRDMIFPVLWFDDGIDGIDDEKAKAEIRKALFTPEVARSIMYPSLIGLGIVIFLSTLFFAALTRYSKRRKVSASAMTASRKKQPEQEEQTKRQSLLKNFERSNQNIPPESSKFHPHVSDSRT